MDDVRLTVLIATSGRRTLANAFESALKQTTQSDKIVVAADVDHIASPLLKMSCVSAAAMYGRPLEFVQIPGGPNKDWGHTPRNHILESGMIDSGHVIHLDDDDCLAPGALTAIRNMIWSNPREGNAFIFRMMYPNGNYLWRKQSLARSRVGTPMFVHPAKMDHLAKFQSVYGGDFDFISDSIRLNHLNVFWCDRVTTLIRPHERSDDPIFSRLVREVFPNGVSA